MGSAPVKSYSKQMYGTGMHIAALEKVFVSTTQV